MNIDEILIFLYGKRSEFLGVNMLKKLCEDNKDFFDVLVTGIKNGKVFGFTELLWQKIEEMNTRIYKSAIDIFKDGKNIGACNQMSIELSYLFDTIDLVSGFVPFFKGTPASPDGRHCWLEDVNYLYDTSTMLMISKDYISSFGYLEKKRIPYSELKNNRMYRIAKDFATDKNIKKRR